LFFRVATNKVGWQAKWVKTSTLFSPSRQFSKKKNFQKLFLIKKTNDDKVGDVN
jgi:hypothetical protein